MKRRALVSVILVACASAPRDTRQSVVVPVVQQRPEPARPVYGRREVASLPLAEALPTYRGWISDDDPAYATEAITQVAWAQDRESVPAIAKALSNPAVRAVAARALGELGDDRAKPALRAALNESTGADRAVVVWSLVRLGDAGVADDAIAEHRSGTLETQTDLDGEPAFSLERLVTLLPASKAAALAASDEPRIRGLGLAVLTRDAGNTAPAELGAALEKADHDTWMSILDAIGGGAGGKGLVLALPLASRGAPSPSHVKLRTKAIFDRLRARSDPGAADTLVRYLETKPEPRWRTEAALRLAEIGDVRAAPTLAWRMEQDPLKLYSAGVDDELRRDDSERVACARMLGDLATLHPAERAELRKVAWPSVRQWLTSRPQPHANGLRFIARAEVREGLPLLRRWANPSVPFPRAGQQNFPFEWATAQSALRYLGASRDGWTILETQLQRRPATLDATMDGLLGGGNAVLGMTVRALGTGASQGFAEWGDPRAFPLLVKFIEDPLDNEQARMEAAFALAVTATDAQMEEIAQKIRRGPTTAALPAREEIIRSCYLEALARHPSSAGSLVDLVDAATVMPVRRGVARALGAMSLPPAITAELRRKVGDPGAGADAALALLLGGSADDARFVMGAYAGRDPAAREELHAIYGSVFVDLSVARYDDGSISRWTANAVAASHARTGEGRVTWVRTELARALRDVEFDRGPRSLTRVSLRARLRRDQRADVLRLIESRTSP